MSCKVGGLLGLIGEEGVTRLLDKTYLSTPKGVFIVTPSLDRALEPVTTGSLSTLTMQGMVVSP